MSQPFRIGIYDAYLSTLGGGENFVAVFAEFLEHEYPDAQVDLITYAPYSIEVERLQERFGVELRRTKVRVIQSAPRGYLCRLGPARRYYHELDVGQVSREYDLFVNNTIYSLAPPRSRRSLYMCMFPLDPSPMVLRRQRWRRRILAPYVLARRQLYRYWMRRYDMMLANSEYTRRWIERMWGLPSEVLYPPVETVRRLSMEKKGGSILSIGRFFPGNHNKKHDVLIDAFIGMVQQGGLLGWQLHLVGGKTENPGTDEYISQLRRRAAGFPIHFYVDASRNTLRDLLERSSLFWHATGFGEDGGKEPEKLEHFGLSTVEAMTHGCVPVVFDSGGQGEIIEEGVNGFLWRNLDEFRQRSLLLSCDETLREAMGRTAHEHSQAFSRRAFRARSRQLLSAVMPAREGSLAGLQAGSARHVVG